MSTSDFRYTLYPSLYQNQHLASSDTSTVAESPNRKLYDSLSPPQQSLLFDAILSSRLLRFKQANTVFSKLPATHIIVALEHTSSLLTQGAYSTAENIIKQALENASVAAACATTPTKWSGWKSMPEFRLLQLLLAFTECFTKANFTSAWREMKRTLRWLHGVPLQEYSDLHVACVGYYYQLVALTRHISNSFAEAKFGDIVRLCSTREFLAHKELKWGGITSLREWLQNQGRINQAYQILRREITFSETDQVGAIKSFLSACSNLRHEYESMNLEQHHHEPLWWVEGNARLLLAGYAQKNQESVHEAESEIKKAEELFVGKNIPLDNSHNSSDELLDQLQCKIEFSRLSLPLPPQNSDIFQKSNSPSTSPEEEETIALANTIAQWQSLAALFHKQENYFQEAMCLRQQASICDELSGKQSLPSDLGTSSDWDDRFLKVHSSLQKIQRTAGDAYFIFTDYLSSVAYRASNRQRGVGDALEWLTEFEKEHEFSDNGFQFWALRRANLSWMLNYATTVGNMSILTEVMGKVMKLSEDEKSFWADETVVEEKDTNREDLKIPNLNNLDIDDLGIELDQNDQNWYLKTFGSSHPIQVAGFSSILSIEPGNVVSGPVWRALLSWMKKDLDSGNMGIDMLREILVATTQGLDDTIIRNYMASIQQFDLQRTLLAPQGKPTPLVFWNISFQALRRWLLSNQVNPRTPVTKREWVLMAVAAERRILVPLDDPSAIIHANQTILDLLPQLSQPIQQTFKGIFPACLDTIATAKCMSASSPDSAGKDLKDILQLYAEAEDLYEEAASRLLYQGDLEGAARTYHNLGRLFLLLKRLGMEFSGMDWTTSGLKHAELSEKLMNTVRREVAVLDMEGFDTQRTRMEAGGRYIWNAYDLALTHLWLMNVKGDDGSRERRDLLIWEWVQRGKARVLNELMGIGSVMAERLLATAVRTNTSRLLVEEEQSLAKKIQSSQPMERQALRKQQAQLVQQMMEHGELKEVVAAREGSPFTLEDCKIIAARLHKSNDQQLHPNASHHIILVDWYYPSDFSASPGSDGTQVTLTAVKINYQTGVAGQPRAWKLNITAQSVNTWVEQQLHVDDLSRDDANHEFRRLDALVAPLADFTNPNDTIVLCPTKTLHRIPLHALHVSGQLLIRRNPIVYCNSLSLLRYSFIASDTTKSMAPTSQTVSNNETALVFGDPPTPKGKAVLAQVALKFNAELHIGPESTKGLFCTSLNQTDATQHGPPAPVPTLVHFHGHCWWPRSGSPLDHCLQFAGNEVLTAREVFKLRSPPTENTSTLDRVTPDVPSSFHLSLIACGSGLNDAPTVATDNVIGLVPAFLYSGAKSTISTLWPIDDQDGAKFSTRFYSHWYTIKAEDNNSDSTGTTYQSHVVNLAQAFQKTIVGMLDEHRQEKINSSLYSGNGEQETLSPYHWAGFVLHGCWLQDM